MLILSILPIVFLHVRLQAHTHMRSTNEKSTISGQFVITRQRAPPLPAAHVARQGSNKRTCGAPYDQPDLSP